ncbi:alpha/beta hydrolase [Herbaspirillum sp. alder98]|uniref:alpha/beta hydrolase n=1 Tax=Herbaspirillum sp. alder98 TaxID=2913096 RepID=UPI001CD8FAC1|nr:alpha/beta hydrolase-fold protein [Herbaspirillum sp. alder98]MCA1325444.1 prolyl oligopeptidase family serine peptidase [Herbaspirillum sp. alder98]
MTAHFSSRRRLLAAASLAVLGGLAPALVRAQPDLSRPLGPTIADAGSAFYRFERWLLPSEDGQRRYRITLGIPRKAPPAAGHPAIVLLDGNAALAAIDEPQLQLLDAATPPLIVAIGYDTDLRFDVTARAFDYTPPIPAGQVDDELARGRRGGGADGMLALIEQQILPRVRDMAPVDSSRLALWGHSYGGLFVLHTLFSRSQLFADYIAASPSLWWGRGVILQEEQRFRAQPPVTGRRLWLMAGDSERRERPAAAGARQPPAGRLELPPQALPDLAARLRGVPGMTVDLRIFAGMSHGPMLPASLQPALRIAAGLAP